MVDICRFCGHLRLPRLGGNEHHERRLRPHRFHCDCHLVRPSWRALRLAGRNSYSLSQIAVVLVDLLESRTKVK